MSDEVIDYRYHCPHCNGALKIKGSVRVSAITIDADDDAPTKESVYLAALPESKRVLLTSLRSSGIYDTIVRVKRIREGKDMTVTSHFVLTFLRDVTRHMVPSDVLHSLANTYRGDIKTLGHNGVSLVLSNGRIVLVVPTETLRGSRHKMGGTTMHTEPSRDAVEAWIRTRNGYVPTNKQLMLAALQFESRGGFQIPDTPNRTV